MFSLTPLLPPVRAGFRGGPPASPVLAQDAAPPPQKQASLQGGVPISLGLNKYHYTNSPGLWPNITAPYRTWYVNPGALSNSPRLAQLIQSGKMNLSLQDAIALALENSMDIVVQRYNPWMADASILKTKAGGFGYGVPGSLSVGSTANLPSLIFDPYLTQTISITSALIPVNTRFTSGTGTGTNGIAALGVHQNIYNTAFSQGFSTGTTLNVFWDNPRSSSSSAFTLFDPSVQSTIGVSFAQQLLQGVGRNVTRRNILVAKNNRKIADLAFAQQAITTVTNTITAYWELVYARQNVDVQQQAVTVAEKLYNDNKKQLEIGTMAPLDVTRAESELATDHQNLIVAQTAQLQQEQTLKNAISKDPLATNFVNVHLVPSDKPTPPAAIEAPSFEDALREAFAKRPDLQEQFYNLKNADIDVRATKNALLPTATLNARYGSQGLSGNSAVLTNTTIAGSAVVGANGQPVTVLDSGGNSVQIFLPATSSTVASTKQDGFGTAQSQIFHSDFPDYAVYLNLQVPIRNRSAQADSQRSILTRRQQQAVMQQLRNSALLDVRNPYIALVQDRARVEAAAKASELQRQTFDAEQKKYQLGASTVYNVILTQRDFITAKGTELRALADLGEAKANYERAIGRTLETNRVTIADAKSGVPEKDSLIPGTLNGKVVGTDALFKKLDAANSTTATSGASGQK